jgi:hypothetical protein
MSNETISDLRSHLFGALRGLSDKQNPLDIERAKAIAEVAQVVVNSAKVEVEHMKLAGGKGSGFIPEVGVPSLPDGATVIAQKPGVTVTRHTLKG